MIVPVKDPMVYKNFVASENLRSLKLRVCEEELWQQF